MGTEEDGTVYHPEMIEDDAEDRPEGLDKMDCFLDIGRLCGPNCMAYITYPRGDPKELSEYQSHCALLLFGERIARHVTVLASTVVETTRKKRTASQDAQRAQSMGVPDAAAQSPFSKKGNS